MFRSPQSQLTDRPTTLNLLSLHPSSVKKTFYQLLELAKTPPEESSDLSLAWSIHLPQDIDYTAFACTQTVDALQACQFNTQSTQSIHLQTPEHKYFLSPFAGLHWKQLHNFRDLSRLYSSAENWLSTTLHSSDQVSLPSHSDNLPPSLSPSSSSSDVARFCNC